jgi:hypothetical protein
MNRRNFLIATALAIPTPLFAAPKPWSTHILSGGFDGKTYQAGVLIELTKGWKTYWRVPGGGGVPPSIMVTGENIRSYKFDCPLPLRLAGPEGENIGYHDQVCFPVSIEPVDAAKPVIANLDAFFGVCDTICIPVPLAEPIKLDSGADAETLRQWQMKIPQKTTDAISNAKFIADKNLLEFTSTQKISDIFIECADAPILFNAAPIADGNIWRVPLSGLKPGQSLAGKSCLLTIATEFAGLEQTVTLG